MTRIINDEQGTAVKQSSLVCIKIDFCDADIITIQENIFIEGTTKIKRIY